MPLKSGARTWTIADLIVVLEADLQRTGSEDCTLVNLLRSHVDDWTIEDFENHMFNSPEGPEFCFLSILSAHRYNEEPIASELQEYYAEEFEKMDFEIVKPYIEQLLTKDFQVKIGEDCLHKLHDIIDEHHPTAEAFQALDLANPRPG